MKRILTFSKDIKFENNTKKKFLVAGDWVPQDKKKKIKYEYDVFKPFFSKKKRELNSKKSNKIYQRLFNDLYKELNIIHATNFQLKEWKIIFGNWLKRFVDLCFQADNIINEILNSHKIDTIYGKRNNNLNFLCGSNTHSIHYFSRDHIWLNNLYYEIIKFYNFKKIKLRFKDTYINKKKEQLKDYDFSQRKKTTNLKKVIFNIFNFFLNFKKKNDAVITNIGSSFIYEKLLELSFFQLPSFYNTQRIKNTNYNQKIRSKIKIIKKIKKKILKILSESIYTSIFPNALWKTSKKYIIVATVSIQANQNLFLQDITMITMNVLKFLPQKR